MALCQQGQILLKDEGGYWGLEMVKLYLMKVSLMPRQCIIGIILQAKGRCGYIKRDSPGRRKREAMGYPDIEREGSSGRWGTETLTYERGSER